MVGGGVRERERLNRGSLSTLSFFFYLSSKVKERMKPELQLTQFYYILFNGIFQALKLKSCGEIVDEKSQKPVCH